MKYQVKKSCGHIEQIELVGPMKERERKIQWLQTQPCRDCKTNATAKAAKAAGLPELTGTEKQVKWALDIRAKWLAEKSAEAAKFGEQAEAVKEALVEAAATKTSAAWWIENRFSLNSGLAEAYETALKAKLGQ